MGEWHDMLYSIEERRETREVIDRTNAFMAERFPDDAAVRYMDASPR
jgi:hypothetical protein